MLSALLETQIRIPGDVPQRSTAPRRKITAELRECLVYLHTHQPEVLRLTGVMALVNLVEIPAVLVGIPVAAVQYLGRSNADLGMIQAVLSVGGLAGGMLAGVWARRMDARRAIGLLQGIAGLCAALGAVLWLPRFACAGVALCGFGVMAAAMLFNVWLFALLQTLVPQEQLGRVTGCTVALASLTQPVGQAAYGVLFGRFSVCPMAVLLGAGVVSVAVLGRMKKHFAA